MAETNNEIFDSWRDQGSTRLEEKTIIDNKSLQSLLHGRGRIMKKSTNEESKICIPEDQIKHLIKRVHDHNGIHLDQTSIIKQILKSLYWWPSISKNTHYYIIWKCPKCENKVMRGVQCGAITTTDPQEDWRTPFIVYLTYGEVNYTKISSPKKHIAIRSRRFSLINKDKLIKEEPSGMQRKCISRPITMAIIAEACEDIASGHFVANLTLHRI